MVKRCIIATAEKVALKENSLIYYPIKNPDEYPDFLLVYFFLSKFLHINQVFIGAVFL